MQLLQAYMPDYIIEKKRNYQLTNFKKHVYRHGNICFQLNMRVVFKQTENCFHIDIGCFQTGRKLFPDRHQAASRQTDSCFKLDTMLKGNQTYVRMRYTSCSICACLSSSGLRSLAIFFLFPRGFVDTHCRCEQTKRLSEADINSKSLVCPQDH